MIDLKEVPDKVFASEMMGPGVAFISNDGKIYSPCDGELITVFPTKHAIGIKANNGAEILIHFGLDTIQLEGKGFKQVAKEGQSRYCISSKKRICNRNAYGYNKFR